MNRRGVALVVGVVLAIGLGAWWLSALPVEENHAPLPAPAPIAEVAPPSIVQPIAPPAEPVVAPPAKEESDAGVMAEVEIEVVQSGKQIIGVRVELAGPGGRVSRPTDVMGYARFTLPVGSWRILSPKLPLRIVPHDGGSWADYEAAWERENTVPLEVSAPLTRFRMELPTEWILRGRVVDNRMQPVAGAEVSWTPSNLLDRSVLTGPLGEFAIKTTEPSLQVQANRGMSRSMMRTASRGAPIELVLEEWTQLKVDVTGGGLGSAFVRVIHRDEIVAVGLTNEPLRVPVGNLSVLARRNFKGRAYSGRARIEAKSGIENQVEVDLSPTPPITGKLVDAAGNAMPGLSIHIREVDLTELLEIAKRYPSSPNFEQVAQDLKLAAIARRADGGISQLTASTATDLVGEFSWTPRVTRNPDPLFQVIVTGLWRTKAESVLVKLDDAPLSIEVEPAPPR